MAGDGGRMVGDGGRMVGDGDSRFTLLLALLGGILLVYFALPLLALGLGQSPAGILEALADPGVGSAAIHTLLTASVSTLLAAALGVPLAYWLARTTWRGAPLVTALVVFPLVLPPIVAGMLLLSVFGQPGLQGLIGFTPNGTLAGVVLAQTFVAAPFVVLPPIVAGMLLLSLFGQPGLQGLVGFTPNGTLAGVVLAQTFVASPFVVLPAKSAFEGQDPALVEAAWSAGVSEWRTFRRVTLPLAAPAILAGVTLAFARAAGEFGATLMVAYTPRTLPVQIWVGFQNGGLEAAYPVALVLVGIAVAALAVVRSLGGRLSVDVDR